MHLLAAKPGVVSDGAEAVDLDQTPGDIVVLSAADTELASLAAAQARRPPDAPELRLANLLQLRHHVSVDLYVEKVVRHARLVVVRLLGGAAYWPYGIERIADACRRGNTGFAALPGDHRPDPDLARLSTVADGDARRLWQYLVHGGAANADGFLAFAAHLAGRGAGWTEPVPLMPAGLYWTGLDMPDAAAVRAQWAGDNPVAAVVFYRALLQSGDLEPVDALIAALAARGLNPLPLYVQSLRDEVSAAVAGELLSAMPPAVVLNATGFAVSSPGGAAAGTPFDASRAPVLQTVLAAATEAGWKTGDNGLAARDIAMNVALPEVDGRIVTRAVAFKSESAFDTADRDRDRPLPERAGPRRVRCRSGGGLGPAPPAAGRGTSRRRDPGQLSQPRRAHRQRRRARHPGGDRGAARRDGRRRIPGRRTFRRAATRSSPGCFPARPMPAWPDGGSRKRCRSPSTSGFSPRSAMPRARR